MLMLPFDFTFKRTIRDSLMPKLDVTAVETYAKAYAAQLCNEQYAQQNRINGDALLRFSPVSQVNLFVIRDLYDAWKETATAFRSPYFNFESTEVKTALQSFLNTVSQHISVERKDLEALVAKATHESLELLLAPKEYFQGWLRELPDYKLTADQLKAFKKYNRIHTGIAGGLAERLGTESAASTTQAILWLDSLLNESSRLDATPTILDQFAKTLPLDESTLYVKEASANFFEQVAPGMAGSSPSKEEGYAGSSLVSRAESSGPEPMASTIPSPSVPAPDYAVIPTAPPVTVAEDVTASVNDPFAMQPTNLNEKFRQNSSAAEETVSSQFQHKPIASLHSFISLNHKFIFINQLFQGDAAAYHQAVDELEKCQSFDQAKDLMNRVYSTQYKWRDVADEADDFYEIVKRRFQG